MSVSACTRSVPGYCLFLFTTWLTQLSCYLVLCPVSCDVVLMCAVNGGDDAEHVDTPRPTQHKSTALRTSVTHESPTSVTASQPMNHDRPKAPRLAVCNTSTSFIVLDFDEKHPYNPAIIILFWHNVKSATVICYMTAH